jgi:hypothetical protein
MMVFFYFTFTKRRIKQAFHLQTMTVIEECCKCMKAMIYDGTIQPVIAFGHEMAEMHVRGRD